MINGRHILPVSWELTSAMQSTDRYIVPVTWELVSAMQSTDRYVLPVAWELEYQEGPTDRYIVHVYAATRPAVAESGVYFTCNIVLTNLSKLSFLL